MSKLILVKENTIRRTCGACPTIFEFEDFLGNEYYFRLRHGEWRLSLCTLNAHGPLNAFAEIASGGTYDFDGICSWEEAVKLMGQYGVTISYDVEKYGKLVELLSKYYEADEDDEEGILEEIERINDDDKKDN